MDKCSLHLRIKEIILATDGDHYRKLEKIHRGVEPSSSGHMYKTVPAPNAQATLQKRGRKDCERQMTRDFAVRLYLPVTLEATHKVSPT